MSDAIVKKPRIRKAPVPGVEAPARRRARKSVAAAATADVVKRVRGPYDPRVLLKVGVPVAAITRLIQIINEKVEEVVPGRGNALRRTTPASHAIIAEVIRHAARLAIVAAVTSEASTITDVQIAKAAAYLQSPLLGTLKSGTFGNVDMEAVGLGGGVADYDAERVLWAELEAKAKAAAKVNAAKKAAKAALETPVVDVPPTVRSSLAIVAADEL